MSTFYNLQMNCRNYLHRDTNIFFSYILSNKKQYVLNIDILYYKIFMFKSTICCKSTFPLIMTLLLVQISSWVILGAAPFCGPIVYWVHIYVTLCGPGSPRVNWVHIRDMLCGPSATTVIMREGFHIILGQLSAKSPHVPNEVLDIVTDKMLVKGR